MNTNEKKIYFIYIPKDALVVHHIRRNFTKVIGEVIKLVGDAYVEACKSNDSDFGYSIDDELYTVSKSYARIISKEESND